MKPEDIFYIGLGIAIGLFIAYFFWSGQSYYDLKGDYKQCQIDYQELNESYNQLQEETGQLLRKYQSCVGRETFFEWVNRLTSLSKLARLFGII
jgi:hypothetical protein